MARPKLNKHRNRHTYTMSDECVYALKAVSEDAGIPCSQWLENAVMTEYRKLQRRNRRRGIETDLPGQMTITDFV